MVEISEQDLQNAKFYEEVYSLLRAFTQWRQLPVNVEFQHRSISRALEIIRDIIMMKG